MLGWLVGWVDRRLVVWLDWGQVGCVGCREEGYVKIATTTSIFHTSTCISNTDTNISTDTVSLFVTIDLYTMCGLFARNRFSKHHCAHVQLGSLHVRRQIETPVLEFCTQ
jgi:hypothetical protein